MTLKTSAVLTFIGGMLEIRDDGSLCRLSISDDDLDYGEGGERLLNLLPSEVMAIRDFLNKHVPWNDEKKQPMQYCLHKPHPDLAIEAEARRIYLSRYGGDGGRWELVETPEHWWAEARLILDQRNT